MKIPDLGIVFVGTLAFWLIFEIIQELLIRIGYRFDLLIFAFITVISIVYFINKRGKYYEDVLKRIQDELEFQRKINHIDLTKIIERARWLKEKDDKLMENIEG